MIKFRHIFIGRNKSEAKEHMQFEIVTSKKAPIFIKASPPLPFLSQRAQKLLKKTQRILRFDSPTPTMQNCFTRRQSPTSRAKFAPSPAS